MTVVSDVEERVHRSSAVLGDTTVSLTVGDQEISFETGKLAKQADGAVVVRSGETMVLATAQGRMETREGADFFPLTVDVEERMYAAGKIPGGFFKREGRPTERAILTARMIDRPIRPLWPKGFRNEVQVICTVLSADLVTPHDVLCLNGASAALMISPLPFAGPVGAVRMGMVDGKLVVNPTLQETEEESTLDLIVVGTLEGLTMVEAGAAEIPESQLLEALELAHQEIKRICDVQLELAEKAGKPKWLDTALTDELKGSHGDRIRAAIGEHGLREAGATVEEIFTELSPEITMDSTEEDITRQVQVRQSLSTLLETLRLDAVEGPVRAQFENELRALTDAEQDSKELKSAKRGLLFDRIVETVELPFPVGSPVAEGEPAGQGHDDEAVHQAGLGGDLQGSRPQEDRDREAASRRARNRGDPPDRDRGGRLAPHARLGALHPGADADHESAHARDREGGAADRRPLPGDRPPVHAPLQLPALLGRGDRLHAWPEAA